MSVQTLEDEENAAKHQLTAMHQQRVLERINRRKKEAMKCFTQALTKTNPDVSLVIETSEYKVINVCFCSRKF